MNFSSYIANPIKQNKYVKIVCGILILPLAMLSVKLNNFAFKQLFYIGIIVCLWYLFDFKYLKRQKESHGNISFFLFAIHQPILIPEMNRLFSLMFKNSVFCGVTFILLKILGIVAMILFCFLILLVLKKNRGKKVLNYLTGGRS